MIDSQFVLFLTLRFTASETSTLTICGHILTIFHFTICTTPHVQFVIIETIYQTNGKYVKQYFYRIRFQDQTQVDKKSLNLEGHQRTVN